MFKTVCAVCGKPGFVYAKDRQGTLPEYYCSNKCEKEAKYELRFRK